MISANQKYKQSGTTKSFKEWLQSEQEQGGLDVHNSQEFVSADGDNKRFAISKTSRNILIVLGLVAIGYGIHRMSKKG